MALEIERKFLVIGTSWKGLAAGSRRLEQFYLAHGTQSNVRIRIADDAQAWLTIKSARAGMTRDEFEYDLPLADARAMIALAEGSIIEKTRHLVVVGRHAWEVDVFDGENAGLVVAEIELGSEDERLELPDWIGKEITSDPRYYNASLVRAPFQSW